MAVELGHDPQGLVVSVQPGEMRAWGRTPFPGLDVGELSEGLGKAPEGIWEGSRNRRTANGTGCSESGSSVFVVETGEGRTPRPEDPLIGYATGLSGALFLALGSLRRRNHPLASRFVFRLRLSAFRRLHPGLLAPASPPPGIAGSRRSRC